MRGHRMWLRRIVSPTALKEDPMDHEEAYDILYKVGFTASEIDRLETLRREYAERKSSHVSTDQHRLEFIRWLVTTGKLTEQIA